MMKETAETAMSRTRSLAAAALLLAVLLPLPLAWARSACGFRIVRRIVRRMEQPAPTSEV